MVLQELGPVVAETTLVRCHNRSLCGVVVEQLAGGSPEQRVEATCAILRSRSVVADWARDGDSFILNERTCPYPEVARKNSAACAIDTAYVQQLTGMDARLANCRVRGDEGCMYVLAPQSAATG